MTCEPQLESEARPSKFEVLAVRLATLTAIALITAFLMFSCSLRRRNLQRVCENNMRMLHAAAVSACLEMKVGAEKTLPIGTITVYLSPTGRVCPDGKDPYPAFSVINGPTCPQGHKFMPGVPRPLKATDPKTAALYLASGLTNLVEIDPKHWADPIWAPLLHELGLTNSVNDANGTEELNR